MACKRCGGRGYLEDVQRRNGGEWNVLLQCCDITAYSSAVAARKATVARETKEPANVCSVIRIRPNRPNATFGPNHQAEIISFNRDNKSHGPKDPYPGMPCPIHGTNECRCYT